MRLALLVLAALAGLSGGCTVCGLIDQHVYVAPDDPELSGLISDCADGVPPPADLGCNTPTSVQAGGTAAITCSCLPLCERVYAIVNPDPHRPPLVGCTLDGNNGNNGNDGGLEGIHIEYGSTCQ